MLPQKRTVVTEVCGETYSRWCRKTATDVKKKRKETPHKIKGNAEREREKIVLGAWDGDGVGA